MNIIININEQPQHDNDTNKTNDINNNGRKIKMSTTT